VAKDPSLDLTLRPINGGARSLRELLTTFHLAFVALDPFTNESAWILPTAARILTNFDEADVRVAFLVTGTAEQARIFLGPHSRDTLTFADPSYAAVKDFGLERLPAFVHVAMDGTVVNAAEGWHPEEWNVVAEELARVTAWLAPLIPTGRDPGPFDGSPLPTAVG
jgi:hypothetical protein